MTDKQFLSCWQEIPNYSEPDAYVSDLALSTIFGEDEEIPQERIEALHRIWNVAHMTMRDIRAKTGLSQVRFADEFCIPRRTVENWDSGTNTPPDYVKILIARQLGLL